MRAIAERRARAVAGAAVAVHKYIVDGSGRRALGRHCESAREIIAYFFKRAHAGTIEFQQSHNVVLLYRRVVVVGKENGNKKTREFWRSGARNARAAAPFNGPHLVIFLVLQASCSERIVDPCSVEHPASTADTFQQEH